MRRRLTGQRRPSNANSDHPAAQVAHLPQREELSVTGHCRGRCGLDAAVLGVVHSWWRGRHPWLALGGARSTQFGSRTDPPPAPPAPEAALVAHRPPGRHRRGRPGGLVLPGQCAGQFDRPEDGLGHTTFANLQIAGLPSVTASAPARLAAWYRNTGEPVLGSLVQADNDLSKGQYQAGCSMIESVASKALAQPYPPRPGARLPLGSRFDLQHHRGRGVPTGPAGEELLGPAFGGGVHHRRRRPAPR